MIGKTTRLMNRFICLITAFALAMQATGIALDVRFYRVADSPQGTIEYDYDGNARLEYLTEVIPGGSDIVTTYVYDDAGRPEWRSLIRGTR